MTEGIGAKIKETVGTIVPFFMDEAEVDGYPYATYYQSVQPFYTKDGVYKYQSTSTIRVVSDDPEEAETLSESILSAIATSMSSGQFKAVLTSYNKGCQEGIWNKQLDYIITQFY